MPDPAVKAPEDATTSTTTSTSVIVPSVTAPAPKTYDNWGVIELVFGVAVAITVLVGGILAIVDFWHRRRKEKKEEEKVENAPYDDRLKKVEEAISKFRTHDDLDKEFKRLEQKVDHNKDNASTAAGGLNERINRMHDRQNELHGMIVKVVTQMESMATNTQRVESAVERLGERIDDRFDRIHAMLSTRT